MPTTVEKGQLLDERYRLDSLIGQGAMGTVWLAEDLKLQSRQVAVKFLGQTLDQVHEPWYEQFRQEMGILASLDSHAYLVQVRDHGAAEDIGPYLVMDYLRGGSLAERMYQIQQDPDLVIEVLRELCNAVDHLHTQCNIVHGDLKPSNILFDAGNHIRLSDFGIAHLVGSESSAQHYQGLGTPGYRAPEMERGVPQVGYSADMYSLGTIARELLAQSMTVQLQKALDKATSQEPSNRYRAGAELLRALRPHLPRNYGGNYQTPDRKFGFLVTQLPCAYQRFVVAMLEDYTQVFGGRQAEVRALDQWLDQPDEPLCIVQGPTGRGKTALLIRWAIDPPGGWHVLFVPISRRYGTAEVATVARNLAHGLASILGEEPPAGSTLPDQLLAYVADRLQFGLQEPGRLAVILDGLDEVVGDSARILLPNRVAPGVKVLVSARTLANEGHEFWAYHLKWQTANTRILDLALLDRPALLDALSSHPSEVLQSLRESPTFVSALARVSEGDPLVMRMYIDDLAFGRLTPHDLSKRSPGLDEYLNEWQKELDRSKNSAAARDLLKLCSVALGPVSVEDLTGLRPEVFVDSQEVRMAVCEVNRVLAGDGEPDSGYVYNHPRLAEYFREHLTKKERNACHHAFVDYGKRCYDELPDDDCPTYIRRFWVTHLAEAGEWQLMQRVVAMGDDIQIWAEMHYAQAGNYVGYLDDLGQLRTYCKQTKDIPLQVRCALIESSIRTDSSRLSMLSLSEGKLSGDTALAHIRTMADGRRKVQALEQLVSRSENPPFAQILEAVAGIADQGVRTQAFMTLLPYFPDSLLPEVRWSVADLGGDTCIRVTTALLPRLVGEEQLTAVQEVQSLIQKTKDADSKVSQLLELAAHAPEPQKAVALRSAGDAARRITNQRARTQKLGLLSIEMARLGHFDDALMAAQAVTSPFERVVALVELRSYLPPELDGVVSTAAQRAALSVGDPERRPKALRLAYTRAKVTAAEEKPFTGSIDEQPFWGEEDRWDDVSGNSGHEVWTSAEFQMIGEADGVADVNEQVEALERLVPYLPEGRKPTIDDRYIAMASKSAGGWQTLCMRVHLLPYFPLETQEKAASEVVSMVLTLGEDNDDSLYGASTTRDDILSELAVCAALLGFHQQALDALRAVACESARMWRLFEIASRLPEVFQPALRDIALSTLAELHDCDDYRDTVLETAAIGFADHGWYPEALDAVRQIDYQSLQSMMLIKLVKRLPASWHPDLIAIVGALTSPLDTISTYVELVPHLSKDDRARVLSETMSLIRSHGGAGLHAGSLIRLLPYSPELSLNSILKGAYAYCDSLSDNERHTSLAYLVLDLLAANEPWEAVGVAELVPRNMLSETIRSGVSEIMRSGRCDTALEAVSLLSEPHEKVDALNSLLVYAETGDMHNILQKILGLAESLDGAARLVELKRILPVLLRTGHLQDALAVARMIDDDRVWTDLPYAMNLPSDLSRDVLEEFGQLVIDALGNQDRPVLLRNLPALAPVIASLRGPDAVAEIVYAIQQVCGWWQ